MKELVKYTKNIGNLIFNFIKIDPDLLTGKGKKSIIYSEEFEKDEDTNGHIDLIYSLANCRSLNYKLEPMDWL